jgi:hypothetical protein
MKTALLTAVAMLGAFLLAGCEEGNSLEATKMQLINSQQRVSDLELANQNLARQLDEQDQQIATLMGLGDKRLDVLYTLQEIRLGKYTGGWDFSGDDREDGVKVFLTTHDQDGTLLKSAGDVTVKVYDLSAGEQALLGEYTWTAEEFSQTWMSGFMGSYFNLECPWLDGSPATDQVTVYVTFVDYLTGKTFNVQKVCDIHRTANPVDDAPDTDPAE